MKCLLVLMTVFVAGAGAARAMADPGGRIYPFAGGGAAWVDGVPGQLTTLSQPQGVAIDYDGNVFIADSAHFTVRRVNAYTGIISTVAGNGIQGDGGDGLPATLAALSGPMGIDVTPIGDLYIADAQNNRIRFVDHQTGLISTVAGNGNYSYTGDLGLATNASLALPQGVAVAADGDLYIADTENFALRTVDHETGIIWTISDDFIQPRRVAVDLNENVYVMDRSSSSRVYRFAGGTGARTTFAGGGVGTGASGPPTAANLGACVDVAVDDAGNVFIAGGRRVWRVDAATNTISIYAGTGAQGNSGDGDPATNATFMGLGGLAVDNNAVYISDAGANRVRFVVTQTGDVFVNNNTSQQYLDGLTMVTGSVAMESVSGYTVLSLPNVVDVGGVVLITENPDLASLSTPVLGNVGGALIISGNPLLTTLAMPALTSVGDDLTLSGNGAALAVSLSSLTSVGGSVTLESSSDVDLSGAAVGGNTDISTDGANSVEVQVPGGTTSVAMTNGGGSVDADLPDDAVPAGTPFAVLHVSGAGLDPQPGLDEIDAPATVDPVAAYSFTLGGTLAAPAALVFEVILADLSPAEQTAVLDAYLAGRLTLTVQSDAPNSTPQARSQCAPDTPPVVDGCVKVGAFDALGFELPPGVTTGAVKVRIAALVSHFSTYALSIVTPYPIGDCNCDGAVTPGDVPAFVLALIDADAYATAHPGCPINRADSNDDNAIDGQDVQRFVELVVTP